MRSWSVYRVTATFGSLDNVVVDKKYETHEEICHRAWCQLWESPAKRMLQSLCDKHGVDYVKQTFSKGITYEKLV